MDSDPSDTESAPSPIIVVYDTCRCNHPHYPGPSPDQKIVVECGSCSGCCTFCAHGALCIQAWSVFKSSQNIVHSAYIFKVPGMEDFQIGCRWRYLSETESQPQRGRELIRNELENLKKRILDEKLAFQKMKETPTFQELFGGRFGYGNNESWITVDMADRHSLRDLRRDLRATVPGKKMQVILEDLLEKTNQLEKTLLPREAIISLTSEPDLGPDTLSSRPESLFRTPSDRQSQVHHQESMSVPEPQFKIAKSKQKPRTRLQRSRMQENLSGGVGGSRST
ncbi:hypothetical protein HYALB_00006476 [Hymenoscyphus albidus]|uniref:Uncharacterized protein n=1 Tax=Hymenoscyphus albidus TaxID=595503 RepID=A0A9N9LHY1_9HELO|nr:hypothetical protein HYALB_00006476 [Hymenoscyphus albidus]